MLTFSELIRRLRKIIVEEIRNGRLTERALARRVGLSQSHIHNVLSGTRALTVPTADRLLEGLHLSVADLIREADLRGSRGLRPREPGA